jgi:hypothetical protein
MIQITLEAVSLHSEGGLAALAERVAVAQLRTIAAARGFEEAVDAAFLLAQTP